MNPERTSEIRKIVDELEDTSDRVAALQHLESPEELLTLGECYVWSDGMEVPRAMLDHPQCDRGLALNLFRLADGFAWFTDKQDREGQREWAEFCQVLSDRIRENYYPRVEIAYEPGLSAVQRLKAKKAGVPEAFLMPAHPDGING